MPMFLYLVEELTSLYYYFMGESIIDFLTDCNLNSRRTPFSVPTSSPSLNTREKISNHLAYSHMQKNTLLF